MSGLRGSAMCLRTNGDSALGGSSGLIGVACSFPPSHVSRRLKRQGEEESHVDPESSEQELRAVYVVGSV